MKRFFVKPEGSEFEELIEATCHSEAAEAYARQEDGGSPFIQGDCDVYLVRRCLAGDTGLWQTLRFRVERAYKVTQIEAGEAKAS